MERIYLTGFMGSGKSHTGRRLAARLAYPFIDLDDWLENAHGLTIAEIFATQGEKTFREMETQTLRELAQLPRFVLSTGGGTPCFNGNMDWMNDRGLTVFLDPSVATLVSRLESERAHRPLLREGEDLRTMIVERLTARRHHYEKAHLHLRDLDQKADVARLIATHLAKISGH